MDLAGVPPEHDLADRRMDRPTYQNITFPCTTYAVVNNTALLFQILTNRPHQTHTHSRSAPLFRSLSMIHYLRICLVKIRFQYESVESGTSQTKPILLLPLTCTFLAKSTQSGIFFFNHQILVTCNNTPCHYFFLHCNRYRLQQRVSGYNKQIYTKRNDNNIKGSAYNKQYFVNTCIPFMMVVSWTRCVFPVGSPDPPTL